VIEVRVFRQSGKINPLEWRIGVDGEVVFMESGIAGGKMKQTHDRPGPVGKFGTKGYKDAKTQAILVADRHIRDKIERLGYQEVDPNTGEVLRSTRDDEINFSNPAKNLRFMKCRHQPEEGSKEMARLQEVIDSDRAIFTIKRDGMMHPIFIDDDHVHIFTRRMDLCTANYPYLAREIANAKFPPKTILLTELVVVENGMDNRRLMQTLDRSLPERAVLLQDDPFRRPTAIVLGIPYWAGKQIMAELPVGEWIDFMYRKIGSRKFQYLQVMETLTTVSSDNPLDELMITVRDESLEGLVIYDAEAIFGDAVVNFRGREDRPEAWKWKPILEGDFIVVFDPDMTWSGGKPGGRYGKGRLKDLPGVVALYQFGPEGAMHYICNCGSGFTEDQRRYVLRRAANNRGIAGVARIKYESRTFIAEGDDTNALQHPIFLEWHPDKSSNEAFDARLS